MSIKSLPSSVKNGLIIFGLILLCLCAYYLHAVIAPFLISVVFAYILNPIVRALVQRKFPRPWAVLTVFVLGVVIFILFVVPFTVSIFSEAGELLNKMGDLDVKKLAEEYKESEWKLMQNSLIFLI